MNASKTILDHLEDAKNWKCDCGAVCDPCGSDWRWNGFVWEHSHGGQGGHFPATKQPSIVEQWVLRKPFKMVPEECLLVAHDTGDGWYLGVEDSKGNSVAILAWPKSWSEKMTPNQLREFGFEIR